VECEGMIELAKALKPMNNLKKLVLNQNYIREKGMCALFDALKNKKNFEALHLNDNFIVEEAVSGLCDFIVNSEKLRILDLSDCNIKLNVNQYIIEALEVIYFFFT